MDCWAEGADLTEALERVHGGALGLEPEAITGIPLNASGDQRVEQHNVSHSGVCTSEEFSHLLHFGVLASCG